ncbi:hypothetical protein BRAS3843_2730039 [Bradyrhizobium sp. STM 3843]|nr:hypothetical protein BRAS3843_2730039 [Bradyrhizobium sp. STM 3843]
MQEFGLFSVGFEGSPTAELSLKELPYPHFGNGCDADRRDVALLRIQAQFVLVGGGMVDLTKHSSATNQFLGTTYTRSSEQR